MQVQGYVVFYHHMGQNDKALFLDKERALTFAAQRYGQMKELVCPEDILSQPTSTTNVDVCCQAEATATPKPTR